MRGLGDCQAIDGGLVKSRDKCPLVNSCCEEIFVNEVLVRTRQNIMDERSGKHTPADIVDTVERRVEKLNNSFFKT